MVESSVVDRGSKNTMVDCSVVDGGSNDTMVDSSVVDGGSNNTMVESRVVDRGGGNNIVDISFVGDHWGSNRVDNRGGHSMVINGREGVHSSVVGEGVNKSVSISISFSLDNVLDRSIPCNVFWSKGTIGDSSVMSRAVVVGHGVAGNLVLGIAHRPDSSSVVGLSRGGDSLVSDCRSNSIV